MEKITMTPKEKAEDLYNTYIDYTQGDYNCKQCALIAVDEILYIIQNLYFMGTVEYWQEVKKEIEKL
jgi:hypothetical protein